MKACYRCGERKPLPEFYRHSAMADGRLNKCKECTKADVRANREAKLDYYQAYDRARGRRQSKVPVDPVRKRARQEVGYAIARGILVPGPCARCATTDNIEAHHEDYAKPLEVTWLCTRCHGRRHREMNEEARTQCAS